MTQPVGGDSQAVQQSRILNGLTGGHLFVDPKKGYIVADLTGLKENPIYPCFVIMPTESSPTPGPYYHGEWMFKWSPGKHISKVAAPPSILSHVHPPAGSVGYLMTLEQLLQFGLDGAPRGWYCQMQ